MCSDKPLTSLRIYLGLNELNTEWQSCMNLFAIGCLAVVLAIPASILVAYHQLRDGMKKQVYKSS
jgi:hypothetical protein